MGKDFFGNKLEVGDTVAFMKVGYRYLVTGTVVKITKQMVVVEYPSEYPCERDRGEKRIQRQYHDQVIKRIAEDPLDLTSGEDK